METNKTSATAVAYGFLTNDNTTKMNLSKCRKLLAKNEIRKGRGRQQKTYMKQATVGNPNSHRTCLQWVSFEFSLNSYPTLMTIV